MATLPVTFDSLVKQFDHDAVVAAPGAGFVLVIMGYHVTTKEGTFVEFTHPDLVQPGVDPPVVALNAGVSSEGEGTARFGPTRDAVFALPENQSLGILLSRNEVVSGTLWIDTVSLAHAQRRGLV